MFSSTGQYPAGAVGDASKPGLVKLEDLDTKCALWRYRCPLSDIEDLEHVNSKYSPEFVVGGVPWRIHLQFRQEQNSMQVYLAIHLQCMTNVPGGTYGHFKLVVCNAEPERSKGKNFHCHFKKPGSAWGLHHFIQKERLLHQDNGFIDFTGTRLGSPSLSAGGRGPSSAGGTPCVVIDALISVVDPDVDGSYVLSSLPIPQQHNYSFFSGVGAGGALVATSNAGGAGGGQGGYIPPHAALQYPYDDTLCDLTFSVENRAIKAHRCIVLLRCPKIIPGNVDLDDQEMSIQVATSIDVFDAFLRYVYTEEMPEKGHLRAEGLLDLYLLAIDHDFNGLAEQCIKHVTPLLNHENILNIVLSRSYNDEILTNVYLRVLADKYDMLIEDPQFESLPGLINRRLSLIVRGKEYLPPISFSNTRTSLSSQLAQLLESGANADYEVKLADGSVICLHRVVLASRSVAYNHAFYHKGDPGIVQFDSRECDFSARAWQKFFTSLYRGSLISVDQGPAGSNNSMQGAASNEIAAEDVALVWKLNDMLQLDGRLKKEADSAINQANALRLLVYAEKHVIPKLKEVSQRLVVSSFVDRVRAEPGVWDIISELSKESLLSLFKTVVMDNQVGDGGHPQQQRQYNSNARW